MTRRAVLVPLALVAALLAAPAPSYAGGTTVVVDDMAFGPSSLSVPLGTTVTWSFEDSSAHTTTSRQGFWDSGTKASGTFTHTFASAGRYAYVCTLHPHMTGRVSVPLTATASDGAWRLRWATGAAGEGRDFDVQVRRKGATAWRDWRTDTTRATGTFSPELTGRWQVRARTSDTEGTSTQHSGWSPVRTVRVA